MRIRFGRCAYHSAGKQSSLDLRDAFFVFQVLSSGYDKARADRATSIAALASNLSEAVSAVAGILVSAANKEGDKELAAFLRIIHSSCSQKCAEGTFPSPPERRVRAQWLHVRPGHERRTIDLVTFRERL